MIINLTQHKASLDQINEGVVDIVNDESRKRLIDLLTIEDLPTNEDLENRAMSITHFAIGHTDAMIGGAPFLMPYLVESLKKIGVNPMYAFSKRIIVENENGLKISKFKHEGFVLAK